MQTIKCNKHDALILVLQPGEEFIFTNKLQATVIFYDSRGSPYLKRFIRGRCDEDCPTVKKIFGASSSGSMAEKIGEPD